MTLPLPNLDDREFDDLVDEARSLIRVWDPAWTNHNPSDPGITLLELFAWLAEMLIFRCDQIPDRHRLAFLQLLNGPGWTPGAAVSIDDEIEATLGLLRRRYRAVTAEDYEALALEASPKVARALCVPGLDLERVDAHGQPSRRAGTVGVVVLGAWDEASTTPAARRDATAELCAVVLDHLRPRCLLTTRNVVSGPFWAPVTVEVLLAPRTDVTAGDASRAAAGALTGFLDPLSGGRDGRGWEFGREVLASELYSLLDGLAEVEYVADIWLSGGAGAKANIVAATVRHNDQGEQVGAEVAPHVLPRYQGDVNAVVSCTSLVAVTATVTVKLAASVTSAHACAATRAKLRQLHPLHDGRKPSQALELSSHAVAALLKPLARGGIEVRSVTLTGDARHVRAPTPATATVTLAPGELLDLQVDLVVV